MIDLVNVQEREYFNKKLKECEIGVFMFRPKPIEYTPKPIENTEDKFLDACSEIKKINNYKNNFIFFENINDFSLDDIPDDLNRFKNNKKQLETIVDFGSKSSTMKELTSNLENCLQSIYEKDINNGRKQVNKEYKVFFASFGELKTEPKELEKIIESLNKDEKLKGITFKTDICKWSLNDISNTQKQEYFEKKLKESDIHIFILESKLGEFSEEKLFKACEESTKTDNPKHTFIFFRDMRIDSKENITEDMIRLKKFKDKLDEIKWIYNMFSTTDDLLSIVRTQLELIAQKELYRNTNND